MRSTSPTPKQREYLAFIGKYIEVHRRSPAEADLQAYFAVSAPSVHRTVVALADKGLIEREAGKARSIQLVARDDAPAPPRKDSRRPPDDIDGELDADIAPLVDAMRAQRDTVTKGSCSGHGREPAYIDLAVEGLDGLRRFVACVNAIDRELEAEVLFDIGLNWSEEVVTGCEFELFPEWIMLSWVIEGSGAGGAPSTRVLHRIARSIEKRLGTSHASAGWRPRQRK